MLEAGKEIEERFDAAVVEVDVEEEKVKLRLEVVVEVDLASTFSQKLVLP